MLISTLIGLVILAIYYTQISRVALFWIAFALTRRLGATVGDFPTKTHEKGGLEFNTIGSSLALAVILIFFVILTAQKQPVARA